MNYYKPWIKFCISLPKSCNSDSLVAQRGQLLEFWQTMAKENNFQPAFQTSYHDLPIFYNWLQGGCKYSITRPITRIVEDLWREIIIFNPFSRLPTIAGQYSIILTAWLQKAANYYNCDRPITKEDKFQPTFQTSYKTLPIFYNPENLVAKRI